MSDPAAVAIAIAVMSAATLSIRAIASAVVRLQESKHVQRNAMSDSALEARLARIEQAVDAIAVEIERISEGQRFTTRLLSERTAVH